MAEMLHGGPQELRQSHRNRIREQTTYERSQATQRISELAGQCADLAEQMPDELKLNRIAAGSEWCIEQAEKLAGDSLGDGRRPDFLADVAAAMRRQCSRGQGHRFVS